MFTYLTETISINHPALERLRCVGHLDVIKVNLLKRSSTSERCCSQQLFASPTPNSKDLDVLHGAAVCVNGCTCKDERCGGSGEEREGGGSGEEGVYIYPLPTNKRFIARHKH